MAELADAAACEAVTTAANGSARACSYEGKLCADWAGVDCRNDTAVQAAGYASGAGAEALLHCPAACGAAADAALCTDDAIWRDEHEDGCARWADAAYDCSKATEGAGYISLAGQAQLLQRCPLACGLCKAQHAEVWPSCAAAAAPYAPRQLCDPTSDNEVICNGQNACPDCGCGSDPPASSCIREGGIRAAGWPDSSEKAYPRYDACECPALAEERVGDPVPGLIVSGVVLVLGGACFYVVSYEGRAIISPSRVVLLY